MALGRNGYVQPVEIVTAGVGPARNGWVQPVEIVGGGGGGGAVGDIVDASGSTTDSYVAVTGFPVSRADGLVGIGSILNNGANGMNVRETVTDKFGNTQSVVTVVAAGDSYLLDLQTNFANLAFPPFTDYLVEVQSASAGNATDYDLHFVDITPGAGSGGSESLEDARLVGDTFLGDVYWDGDSIAFFGYDGVSVNLSYLQIFSDKTNGLQVLNSGKVGGVIPASYPISFQMDAVEVLGIDTGSVTVTGKLTVSGAIDPTSLSLSGNAEGANVLYIDSENGISAAVSAANHGRIRYNNTTKTWQVSMDGGAYASISTGGGAGGDWLYDGNTVGSEKSIGTLDNFDFPFISRSNEGARLHNTVDSDATTQLVNFLIGRTTQSDVVEPFSYKLPLDVQREHNQSTYARITNTVNDTHSVAGWIAESTASSQIIVSIMAPNATFADMRAGGAAAIQVAGATEIDIFSEDDVPIRFGIADTEVARFVSTGMDFPGTLMSASLINGVIVFADRIGFDSGLILTNKPVLTGVASPDGGANSVQVEGSHVIVGKGVDDASTGRGLIFEKNDGTLFGEIFGYDNGTPQIATYVGGVAAGNEELRCTSGQVYVLHALKIKSNFGMFDTSPIAQGAAVADASGGTVQDAEARTAINSLLARCRAYGFIAT